MVSTIVIILFLAALVVSIFFGISLIYALLFGLFLFSAYAYYRHFTIRQIGKLIWEGVRQSGVILTILVLVGMLTASWRASGTISYIVDAGTGLIHPRIFYLSVFVLTCLISFITGTSFGTVSTIGVVAMILARVNGYDVFITAGGVMSGAYFGDRCSPMSSSAAMVCSLTGVDIYLNIKNMMKSALLPFILSCVLYLFLSMGGEGEVASAGGIDFSRYFQMSPVALIPAAVVIGLSIFKVDVRINMGLGIISAVVIAMVVQKEALPDLLSWLVMGYSIEGGGQAAEMLQGGGIVSMLDVIFVVLISSAFFGLMRETKMISRYEDWLLNLSKKFGRFTVMVITSVITSGFSCNQTLATMLTCDLCGRAYEKKTQLANDLEDTVIVITALIPWSIACAVPLAAMEINFSCMIYAFYIYLLPLVGLFTQKLRPKIIH